MNSSNKDSSSSVCIQRSNYNNIDIYELIKPLGGLKSYIKKGERVLLKINLLNATEPDKAVVTNPNVVSAVANEVIKNGAIPIINIIKLVISLPILLFILSWFDLLKNFINNNEYLMKYLENIGRFSTIIISLLFCILYLFSGFTWYDNSIFSFNTILSIIEILINSSVGLVMFILFIISFYILVSEIRFKTYIQ